MIKTKSSVAKKRGREKELPVPFLKYASILTAAGTRRLFLERSQPAWRLRGPWGAETIRDPSGDRGLPGSLIRQEPSCIAEHEGRREKRPFPSLESEEQRAREALASSQIPATGEPWGEGGCN